MFLNNFFTNLTKKLNNFVNFFNSSFISFFKKINSYFFVLFNILGSLSHYFILFFLILLFFLYFSGSFFDISNLITILLSNDTGNNLHFFENWIISFNYFFIIYTFFLFLPKFFLFFISLFENLFMDNLNVFLKLDVLLNYDYFNLDVNSISVFTETFTNLIFFKLSCFFSNLFNLSLDLNFFYSNPIFFYSGLLFLLSTILSLILMSYLGLYGVFVTNLITLFIFWLSILFYFDFFF